MIIDLEYATRWPQKHEARYLAAEAIGYLRSFSPDLNVTVRVNLPSAGQLALRDIDLVAPARPNALRIPAVEEASEIERLCHRVAEIERREGLSEGSIRFHPMIESPRGLANASAIANASPRNEALCLGGEDWAHNVGAIRTRSGHELDHVRARLVTVAAEHHLVAIDTVYTWLDDLDGLALDCQRSRELGFRGRATVHPRQIEVIARAYRAERSAVERAAELLQGLSETSVDGAVIYLAHGVILDPRAVFQARLTCLSKGELP